MTDRYFICVWQRPSTINGASYGEASLYASEGEIIREARDYGFEPESVIEMTRDAGRKWQAFAYSLDMDQIARDERAEERQRTPHWG